MSPSSIYQKDIVKKQKAKNSHTRQRFHLHELYLIPEILWLKTRVIPCQTQSLVTVSFLGKVYQIDLNHSLLTCPVLIAHCNHLLCNSSMNSQTGFIRKDFVLI